MILNIMEYMLLFYVDYRFVFGFSSWLCNGIRSLFMSREQLVIIIVNVNVLVNFKLGKHSFYGAKKWYITSGY